MKKIIIFLFVLCVISFPSIKIASAEGETFVKVIYNQVNIFTEPDTSSTVAMIANYGDKFRLADNEKINVDNSLEFYQIYLNNEEMQTGYVLVSWTSFDSFQSPRKELDYNGQTNDKAVIFQKNGNDFIETDITLEKGAKIKLLDGYNKANEYTRIQFILNDDEIQTNYIQTSKIKTSGISRSTIGAIIIVFATVSIVLISFGIKGRHKRSLRNLVKKK